MSEPGKTTEPNISGARGGGAPTDETPGAEARSFQTKPGDTEPATGEGFTFDPSVGEVNRTRLGGVGQKEMSAQRDPTRDYTPSGRDVLESEMSEGPDPEKTDRGQTLQEPDRGNR